MAARRALARLVLPRGFAPRLALVAAAGLVVRVAYTVLIERDARPQGDIGFYHVAAALIAEGQGYAAPYEAVFRGTLVPTAEHPPLWPAVLALVDWLGGDGFTPQRLAGCVAGTATVVLVGLVARRIAGPAAGLAAAAIAAAHPLLIGSDGSLMSESLYGALVALMLLLAYRLSERPVGRRALWLGVATGAAALTRPEALLLLALLLAPSLRRSPRLALIAVASALLVIAPWTARNWITFDHPVLISTNDSTVLAGANCDLTYHGTLLGFWHDACRPLPRSDNEAEVAAQMRSQGLRYARDHAGRLPVVVTVRLLRTWGLWQPGLMTRLAEGRNVTVERVGTVVYWLTIPLALYGAVLVRRRRAVPLWPLAATAVLVSVASGLGYGYPRFRYAADIAIVILTGLAASALARRWRRAGDPA